MKSHHNYYAVAKGRIPGIYSSWSECQVQVDGFKHNSFKGFNSVGEAANFMIKGGISLNEIDLVDGEGEVLLRKSLIEAKPNIMEEITAVASSEEIPSSEVISEESVQEDDIPCISIDGSCRRNGTENAVAGFGIYWGEKHPDNISEEITSSESQTNQVAELTAAVRAVNQVQEKGFPRVCIQTDSMYVIKGITNWIDNWIKNGWKTSQGTDVKHKELWKELHQSCQKVDVKWKHVKGHTGNPANEAADNLSKMATDKGKELNVEKKQNKTVTKENASRSESKIKDTDSELVTRSSQTYPSKLEIQVEDLMSAFKSLENQVVGIIQKSYEDQKRSESAQHQEEIKRLNEKVKVLDDQLQKEKKDKEKLERELKTTKETLEKSKKENLRSNAGQDVISRQENEIRSLKESKDKDRNILNAKEETLASLRK